jgi:phage FluMu protein gp41
VNAAIKREVALTPDDVLHLRLASTQLYQTTMTPMMRPAAHLLSELDSRQINGLAETFAERNRKQREKMLTGSVQKDLEMRAKRHVEFVEDLVGDLSAEQTQKITEMSRYIPFATAHFIEQREAKQAALITLLKEKAGEDRIDALFRQWLVAPAIFRTPQQQQSIAAYESAMNEMTARILALLTSRQKQRLTEKITSYIEDFQKLNANAVEPLPSGAPAEKSEPAGHERRL